MEPTDLTVWEGILLLALGGLGVKALITHVVKKVTAKERLIGAGVFAACVLLGALIFGLRWGVVAGAAAFGVVPHAVNLFNSKFGLRRKTKRAPNERAPEDT